MRTLSFLLCSMLALVGCDAASSAPRPVVEALADPLLQPAPRLPLGSYDWFGELLDPNAAAVEVSARGLDPADPAAYARLGMVSLTQALVDAGEQIYSTRRIGDTLGVQDVFGAGIGFAVLTPELVVALAELAGRPTTNLTVTLQKDLRVGSHLFKKGSRVPTGLDVAAGGTFPVGLLPGNITCALCHDSVDAETGQVRHGLPNTDLNIALLIAFAPNTASGFARLDRTRLDPFAPQFHQKHSGTFITDSKGRIVQLPDPDGFESAMDDLVLDVPPGNFESSPDGIDDTTNIPALFTFGVHKFGFSGEFAVGPFAGLAALTNAVHSSEINLLAAAQLSESVLGLDREVYLGVVLQNAAVPWMRLPPFDLKHFRPWKPSEWLRTIAPDPSTGELENQIAAPGAGAYPNLSPSLLTFNGLLFSPPPSPSDPAGGPFFYAVDAMSAFQSSLVPPANRSLDNALALPDGSVAHGAGVFRQAGCDSCHAPPTFTDDKIHPNSEIGTNPARSLSRLPLQPLLVPPRMYSLDTPVPVPPGALVLDVPTAGITATPTSLPDGLEPNGGYRTTPLRGLYATAPYLHDGGVAVNAGALVRAPSGWWVPASPNGSGLGLPSNLLQAIPPDAASSLRALVDRQLRAMVVAANVADARLQIDNITGAGHPFWVDAAAGFTPGEQDDLVAFLLALDDDPGSY